MVDQSLTVDGNHIVITRHAERRVRQRLGLPRRAILRAAIKALEEGVPRRRVRGDLRRYLDAQRQSDDRTDFIVHGGTAWVFEGDTLITAWPLPGRLTR